MRSCGPSASRLSGVRTGYLGRGRDHFHWSACAVTPPRGRWISLCIPPQKVSGGSEGICHSNLYCSLEVISHSSPEKRSSIIVSIYIYIYIYKVGGDEVSVEPWTLSYQKSPALTSTVDIICSTEM